MTMSGHLLHLADELTRGSSSGGKEDSTRRRRAVSTAYYAVFHELTRMCADELLGGDDETRGTNEYERVYRALDHGSLKTAFSSEPLRGNRTLTHIGDRVVRLQSERIRSDYLPERQLYSRNQSADIVNLAKSTIKLIEGLSRPDRRTLAVYLIFKNRPQ
ncbi:MAG: hypothetical protein WB816_07790 [Methylocystis sp.]